MTTGLERFRSGSTILALLGMSWALLISCSDAPPRAAETFEYDEQACSEPATPSRWLSSAPYTRAGEYGRGEGNWLGYVGREALSYSPAEGRLYVFDSYNAEVVVLTEDLRSAGAFGRRGGGPGEFALQGKYAPVYSVFSTDSTVYIQDLRSISRFSTDGEFKSYVSGARPGELVRPLQLLRMGVVGDDFVYGTDAYSLASAARRVAVIRPTAEGSDTLVKMAVPDLPRASGKLTTGTLLNQAQPLLDYYGDCVIISDGSSHLVHRFDLSRGTSDSVPLPHYEIPQEPEADRERRLGQLEMVVGMAGSRTGNVPTPTAPRRWWRMIVDPDGGIWAEPWRPPSLRGNPVPVHIFSAGQRRVDTVPAFPGAFGPVGTYYSVETDSINDVPVVVRYQTTLRTSLRGGAAER